MMAVDPREMTPEARRAFRRRSAVIIVSLLAIVVLIGGVTITMLSQIGVRDDLKNLRLRAGVAKVAPTDFTTGVILPSNPVSIALGVDPSALTFTSTDGVTWCVKVRARHLLASRTVLVHELRRRDLHRGQELLRRRPAGRRSLTSR